MEDVKTYLDAAESKMEQTVEFLPVGESFITEVQKYEAEVTSKR